VGLVRGGAMIIQPGRSVVDLKIGYTMVVILGR
jgi:hypothetical protein